MTYTSIDLIVFDNHEKLSVGLANQIYHLCDNLLKTQNKVVLALSGGNSPQLTYKLLDRLLIKSDLILQNIFLLQIDERWVSSIDQRSNQSMIRKKFHQSIEAKINIASIPNNDQVESPFEACEQYNKTVCSIIEDQVTIDIAILGMGADGHTASLFPYNKQLLKETTSKVVYGFVENQNEFRISLTKEILNDAKQKIFIMNDCTKAEILKQAMNSSNYEKYPVKYLLKKAEVYCDTKFYNCFLTNK